MNFPGSMTSCSRRHFAIEAGSRGEQCGRAVALLVGASFPAAPLLDRFPGWVRIHAWIGFSRRRNKTRPCLED